MKNIASVAALVALFCAPALAQTPERIPNKAAGTRYPRWLVPVNATDHFDSTDPTIPAPEFHGGAIAVDRNGVVHVVGVYFPGGPTDPGEIGYMQRRFEARTKTSFSASYSQIYNLSNTPTVYSGNPAIAVAPNGDVYVTWEEFPAGPTPYAIVYRKMNASGGWDARVTVEESNGRYPSIAVGADGNVHLAYWFDVANDPKDVMRYRLNFGAWEELPDPNPPPGTCVYAYAAAPYRPVVRVDSTNVPHLAWHRVADGGT